MVSLFMDISSEMIHSQQRHSVQLSRFNLHVILCGAIGAALWTMNKRVAADST